MVVRGTGVKGFAKGKAFVVDDCGQRNPFEGIPPGSILVSSSLSLSDSTLIDFKRVVGIVTESSEAFDQVCVLAKGLGIPALVGIPDCTRKIVSGDRLLIRNLDFIVNPDLDTVDEFELLRSRSNPQLTLDL